MTISLAQDPDELFDIVTAEGKPTGITKRRADVHRDGDWHRAIHVWVHGSDHTGPFLILNQRGRQKDTWPLALDATVGGHLGAGETVEDAYREVEEEIGITVEPDRLRYVGRRACESHGDIPGVIDREIQDIYTYEDNRPLEDFAPNSAELEGLVRVSLDDALRVFAGTLHTVPAIMLHASDDELRDIQIDRSMLIATHDNYFLRIAQTVTALHQADTDASQS